MSLCFQILILALTTVEIVHYPKPPLDIAYQLPNHDTSCQPVLAVACRNGCVALLCMLTSVTNTRSLISNLYTYSADGDPESEVSFVIAPPKANHSVGAIAWAAIKHPRTYSHPPNHGIVRIILELIVLWISRRQKPLTISVPRKLEMQ